MADNVDLSFLDGVEQQLGKAVLFWFRSDLRVHDNRALLRASASARANSDAPLPLYALFVVSPEEWQSHDMAVVKADLILRSVRSLRASLDELNIPLMVLNVPRAKQVPESVLAVCQKLNVSSLFFNYEYEVDESRRDKKVVRLLGEHGITVRPSHDQCVVDPGSLHTQQGKPYTVYSPFRVSWLRAVDQEAGLLALSPVPTANAPAVRSAPLYKRMNGTEVPKTIDGLLPVSEETLANTRAHYPAGEESALARLDQFVSAKLLQYKQHRDFPHLSGTSSLSAYLSIGSVSARQCIALARERNNGNLDRGNESCVKWIQEVIWRDFYRHVLHDFPHVCMCRPFKLETEQLRWQDNDEHFQRWCNGQTGYPIVDAAMRQLNAVGWMHNRLRMIVAMFLSKDLLIDWRKGERYFMQHLVDGDFASNNGGWQWAASTGTDAQPYFRVLNPLLQSEKFDPDGTFIRTWVPELASVASNKAIHDPVHHLTKTQFQALGYPKPIVDHKFARERAIAEFKRVAEVSKRG